MTKEEFKNYYKSASEEDKKHIDSLIGDNLSHYPIVKHFKRETMTEAEIYNIPKKYFYKILNVSVHSETKEMLVNYEALYIDEKAGIEKGHICSRPVEMFISKVDTDKYPNIKQKYRFEAVVN